MFVFVAIYSILNRLNSPSNASYEYTFTYRKEHSYFYNNTRKRSRKYFAFDEDESF